jgi:serine/threonine-protein phosphatase PGAM5
LVRGQRVASAPARERVVHFVRHAQYPGEGAGTGALTPHGRKQAARIARYFRSLPNLSVRSSDAPRAVETAAILAKLLRLRVVQHHRLLREMLPAPVPGMTIPAHKRAEGRRRLARIVARFLKPARGARHDIVVCHGNLIRALLLHVVAGAPDGFHRLRIHHASVTSFRVAPDGAIQLVGYNAQEHLPSRMRTFG